MSVIGMNGIKSVQPFKQTTTIFPANSHCQSDRACSDIGVSPSDRACSAVGVSPSGMACSAIGVRKGLLCHWGQPLLTLFRAGSERFDSGRGALFRPPDLEGPKKI